MKVVKNAVAVGLTVLSMGASVTSAAYAGCGINCIGGTIGDVFHGRVPTLPSLPSLPSQGSPGGGGATATIYSTVINQSIYTIYPSVQCVGAGGPSAWTRYTLVPGQNTTFNCGGSANIVITFNKSASMGTVTYTIATLSNNVTTQYFRNAGDGVDLYH